MLLGYRSPAGCGGLSRAWVPVGVGDDSCGGRTGRHQEGTTVMVTYICISISSQSTPYFPEF